MIRFLQTPTRTKKIVLGALLVLICFTMVITLIPGFSSGDFGPSQGTLARVAGQDITANDVQVMARQIARQQMRGQAVPDQLMPYFLQRAAEVGRENGTDGVCQRADGLPPWSPGDPPFGSTWVTFPFSSRLNGTARVWSQCQLPIASFTLYSISKTPWAFDSAMVR